MARALSQSQVQVELKVVCDAELAALVLALVERCAAERPGSLELAVASQAPASRTVARGAPRAA